MEFANSEFGEAALTELDAVAALAGWTEAGDCAVDPPLLWAAKTCWRAGSWLSAVSPSWLPQL
jgi:hypothetical protein